MLLTIPHYPISAPLSVNKRLRKLENFKLLALKVITYKRWSITRGSKYNDLTWKILVLWKTGY